MIKQAQWTELLEDIKTERAFEHGVQTEYETTTKGKGTGPHRIDESGNVKYAEYASTEWGK